MSYSIMLDAGHGGSDPGAVSEGRREKDDTLRLVLAVGEILQNHGLDVEYTRTTDVYETPYQKAMEANEAEVDYFVSIHRNSSPLPNQYLGVESLVYDLSGIKLKLAENIDAQLETVGFVNQGVHARPNLVVLRRTKMPAVLVEVGFLNSDTDNRLFDENFDDIAQAIARGILDTLGAEKDSVSALEEPLLQPREPREKEPPRPVYRVQVGAFRSEIYAKRLLRELTEQDFPAAIYDSGRYYRVQVGDYDSLDEAVQMERRLKRTGYPTVIVS